MAKKKSKEELTDESLEEGKEKGGKLGGFLIALLVIIIWLAIFAILIKTNVGGIGTMLRPILKNVPVLSMILPDATDEEVAEEAGYDFKSMSEAVDRIKELESELANYKGGTTTSDTIASLQAEINRLKPYEEKAEYYQELKDKFDTEVVYADNAPDIENYKTWYETIDSENAAKIYEQVIKDLEYEQKVKDWAETYSKMDAKDSAAILSEMTGDTDLVVKILNCMTSKKRGEILAEMDTVFAAKITKLLYP